VALGFSPIEFWRTHPTEYFWVIEAKLEQAKPKEQYAGGMSGELVAELYREAYGDE
jgi:hypothetical protein